MDLKEARRLRLIELLDSELSAAELSRRTRIAASTIGRMKLPPGEKHHKGIGEENARRIELATRHPRYWMDSHPRASGASVVVAHHVSQVTSRLPPPVLAWEALMSAETPPPEFETQLPDNAMAPEAPKGTRVIFVAGPQPEPGDWVLIRDTAGQLYCREYRQLRPGQWEAHARNPGFLPMDSERDGLQVVAVFDGIRGRRSPR